MAVLRPDQMIRCSVPVIMAGIIAVSRPYDDVRSPNSLDAFLRYFWLPIP